MCLGLHGHLNLVLLLDVPGSSWALERSWFLDVPGSSWTLESSHAP